jgi:ParB-like chromosome segregation protein Spo0J
VAIVATTVEVPASAGNNGNGIPAPGDLDPRRLGLPTEAKLVDWNLKYEYNAELPLVDIRIADWAQVRDEASLADKASLEEFKTQMGEGVVYPPIVIMHPDVLIDGNHRYRAAKLLKRKTLPAFVVQFSTVDMAKAFSGAMNQLNGRRLTNDEAYRDALTMFGMGLDDEAIAREIGRSRENVRQMRLRKEFNERVEKLNLGEAAERIKDPQRQKLAMIQHDPVFAEAVKIGAETGAKPKTINHLVKVAREATSDTDAIGALERERTELAPAGPPPVRVAIPGEVRQARLHVGGLLKFSENPMVVLDQADDEHRGKAIDSWRRLRDMANAVLGLYGG